MLYPAMRVSSGRLQERVISAAVADEAKKRKNNDNKQTVSVKQDELVNCLFIEPP
jgi:hypothetical protein